MCVVVRRSIFLTLSRLPQSEMSNVRLESIAPEGPSDDLTIFASSSNPIG